MLYGPGMRSTALGKNERSSLKLPAFTAPGACNARRRVGPAILSAERILGLPDIDQLLAIVNITFFLYERKHFRFSFAFVKTRNEGAP